MKKLLLSFLVLTGFLVNHAQAVDIRDAQGRTELINFVIRQEQAISSIQADINALWNICYQYERVYDGVDVHVTNNRHSGSQSTHVKSNYKLKKVRRADCTDADILAHRKRVQDLEHYIAQTVTTIKHMAQYQDLYVNAKDLQGYTAQNYCYTYEIYQEIRNQGGSFQYLPWIYFNPIKGTAATAVGVIGTWCVAGGIAVSILQLNNYYQSR